MWTKSGCVDWSWVGSMKGGAIVEGDGVALAKVEGMAGAVVLGRAEVVGSGAWPTMVSLMPSLDMMGRW